jgi:hypothetical protein
LHRSTKDLVRHLNPFKITAKPLAALDPSVKLECCNGQWNQESIETGQDAFKKALRHFSEYAILSNFTKFDYYTAEVKPEQSIYYGPATRVRVYKL